MPKVLDFGIARLAGDAALQQPLTVDGSLLGTPAYMAPERFSSQPYDGKSDVYSVGITLYQMLAGRLPFVAPHRDPTGHGHDAARRRAAAALGPRPAGASPPWRSVVQQALRKDPTERPTAEELARLLAQAAGLPARARRPPRAGAPGGARHPDAAHAREPGRPGGCAAAARPEELGADRPPPRRSGS